MSENLKLQEKLQRPLEIKDIDFRVQSINNGGYATILAYKDARVDMKRLDDVLGFEYWQRDVKMIDGVLYGGVGIYNQSLGQWIWKWDAGTESNTEKEKGQSSDAFKRACFNLGIGRELYNYPVISIKLNPNEIQDKNGKKYASWGFKLREWRWISQFTDGNITFIAAKDTSGTVRFKWGEYDKSRDAEESAASGPPPPAVDSDSPTDKKEEPKSDEVSNERAVLVAEYEKIYGKKPGPRTKIETLRKKVEEGATPPDDEEEVDLGMHGGPMGEDAAKIDSFTDKKEFRDWAVGIFKKWEGKAPDEHIKEFKDKCNEQFEKIG